MDAQTFDSRSNLCKRPYGAVRSGTAVEFTLRPERRAAFVRGELYARLESRSDAETALPMPWVGLSGDRDLFSCTLNTKDYLGLIWYFLRLFRFDGSFEETPIFQLTVYDGTEAVPTWFGEGMCYQIFPDRFCRLSVPDPTGMVGGRWVHQDWHEEPEYRPDPSGEIRNRDFFGGSLRGVEEKLPYLKSLGVETLYFCPIFEAAENHRYGTADYTRIDPMLGTNEDFKRLCAKAHKLGMHVLLDGVFNHVGFVSRYFNGDGFYGAGGAARDPGSPYYPWFSFSHWPDQYAAWWGIYSLPAVEESQASYVDFIAGSENSVVRSWLRAGADGWRLDVADELPDEFVACIHAAARAEKPDAAVIGEVWEDGSTKIAYGVRRKHVLGRHCDGLMNYPFRTALISYLLGEGAEAFREEMEKLRENYPPFAFYSSMNSLGTHDTLRILTLLGVERDCKDWSRDERAAFRMSSAQRALGKARLKLGAAVLFAFPGAPTVYYGDEAGMEGFEDPFNRRTFPWGEEDGELLHWFTLLGHARQTLPALRRGDIRYLAADGPLLAFVRSLDTQEVLCAVNAGEEPLTLPWDCGGRDLLSGETFPAPAEGEDGGLVLPPRTARLILKG